MRHDWTLLCKGLHAQPREMIDLTNGFSVITITERQRIPAPGDYFVVDPPGLLVSQWVAEIDADGSLQKLKRRAPKEGKESRY